MAEDLRELYTEYERLASRKTAEWPTAQDLARAWNVSLNKVYRILRRFEEAGRLKVSSIKRIDLSGRPNERPTYKIEMGKSKSRKPSGRSKR